MLIPKGNQPSYKTQEKMQGTHIFVLKLEHTQPGKTHYNLALKYPPLPSSHPFECHPHLSRWFLQQAGHWSKRPMLRFLAHPWRNSLGPHWSRGRPRRQSWRGFLKHGRVFFPRAEEGGSDEYLWLRFHAAEGDGDCLLGFGWLGDGAAAGGGHGFRCGAARA